MKKSKAVTIFLSIFAILLSLWIILTITIHCLSLSPSGAVKVRIIKDFHPLIAVKCNSYYDKNASKYFHKTVYSISEKYLSPDGSYTVTMFRIRKENAKYIAYGQPDEV